MSSQAAVIIEDLHVSIYQSAPTGVLGCIHFLFCFILIVLFMPRSPNLG
jgi:hypothetical protein